MHSSIKPLKLFNLRKLKQRIIVSSLSLLALSALPRISNANTIPLEDDLNGTDCEIQKVVNFPNESVLVSLTVCGEYSFGTFGGQPHSEYPNLVNFMKKEGLNNFGDSLRSALAGNGNFQFTGAGDLQVKREFGDSAIYVSNDTPLW